MTIPSDSSRLAVANERLHNASEEDAVFQALCDGLWAKAHDDAACPPERTGSTTFQTQRQCPSAWTDAPGRGVALKPLRLCDWQLAYQTPSPAAQGA